MHVNNGNCPGCLAQFTKYPGFFKPLQDWFFERQSKFPEFHCANAGRGKIDQEIYFERGASNAHYGDSAHNWNVGLDSFFQVSGKYCLDTSLFLPVVQNLAPTIEWYGSTDAKFKERPHFQWKAWRELRDKGLLKLVE